MSTTVTPINIVPTLDSQSILTDPRDILGYQLRYYCTAPKSVSNVTFNSMISIADTASRYQDNPEVMASQVTSDLNTVFNRFFPPGATTINVSTDDNGDGTYNLVIQMAVFVNGKSYTLGADITVTSTGIAVLKWHPQLN